MDFFRQVILKVWPLDPQREHHQEIPGNAGPQALLQMTDPEPLGEGLGGWSSAPGGSQSPPGASHVCSSLRTPA